MLQIFKGGYHPSKSDILFIFLHNTLAGFVFDCSGNTNPKEIKGIKFVIPGYQNSFQEYSLNRFLSNSGINQFLSKTGDRFYLKKDSTPEQISDLLNQIEWLTETHRSVLFEISLKHKDSGFMKEIEHHESLSIFFHKDFKTLEQRIESATFQIRRIPNVNERKHHKDVSEGSAFAFKHGQTQYLATAKHVTDGKGERFEVFHNDHSLFHCKTTELYSHDIQILEIERKIELPSLSLGDSDLLELTDEIYVSGYPHKLGVRPTISLGHISKINASYEDEMGLIQISSAAINPKNSGGPVINEQGEVIGLLTSRAKNSGDGLQNIAFAEPINRLRNLLK
jgi:S1-C subfamily serine protease